MDGWVARAAGALRGANAPTARRPASPKIVIRSDVLVRMFHLPGGGQSLSATEFHPSPNIPGPRPKVFGLGNRYPIRDSQLAVPVSHFPADPPAAPGRRRHQLKGRGT